MSHRLAEAARPGALAAFAAATSRRLQLHWPTFHFDNYSHTYWHRTGRVRPDRGDASPGNWTAHGRTFTRVPAEHMAFTGAPVSSTPRCGNFLEHPGLLVAEVDFLASLLQTPYCLQRPAWPSPSKDAADYGHPLGCRHMPDFMRRRLVPGTHYRPTLLQATNCGSSAGLIDVVTHILDDDMDDDVYRLYRWDINLYWRIIKIMAHRSAGPFLTAVRHLTFFMSPWHTAKQLACEIWHTLAPGATSHHTNFVALQKSATRIHFPCDRRIFCSATHSHDALV